MYEERIQRAARDGREWVVLEEASEGDADEARRYRRVEMHIPTGVVVLAAVEPGDDGRPRYRTESYFVNRRTGTDLPCGSRRWNVGVFHSREEWEAAVRAAKDDVPRRFAGLVRIYERQRRRDLSNH